MYPIYDLQYGLSPSQKADIFLHVLDGAARNFFFDNCCHYMPFNTAAKIMLTKFFSDARQLQVRLTLKTLRLRSFMEERKISDIFEGLMKMVDLMNELLTH